MADTEIDFGGASAQIAVKTIERSLSREIVVYGVLRQAIVMDKGTSLILVPQPSCAATLVSAVHTASDFLKSAVLRNNSDRVLTGYRLGWCTRVESKKKPQYRLGKRVTLPQGIGPNGAFLVPAQEVSIGKERSESAVAVFFIAEVIFADAKPWKVDLREIEHCAETNLTGS